MADIDFLPIADFNKLERREVTITQTGLTLTVHYPASGSRGMVLLIPGWSGPRAGPADILVYLAEHLSAAGWTAVRMDLPGRGDADGDFGNIDLDAMIEAASAVVSNYAKPGAPSVLIGLCSGGNVALGASTLQNPKSNPDISGQNKVIALSVLPFQQGRSQNFECRRRWKNIKQYAAKAFSPQTWARLIKGEVNIARVKKNVIETEKPASGERNLKDSARDIEQELQHWKGPALFIWGSGDEESSLARAHYEKLHAAGMGAWGETVFHSIDGANHNFYSRTWREQLSQKILEFINDGELNRIQNPKSKI